MDKFQLTFWFEHGGYCIWGKNSDAKEKYGTAIKNDSLPISEKLVGDLNALEEEYATFLNWEIPLAPSLWTAEHKVDFVRRATIAYERLRNELGPEFEVENEISQCVE